MYSNLLPTDASAMLDHLSLSTPINPPTFNTHWRGRYGLTESEQEEIWATKNPDSTSKSRTNSNTTPTPRSTSNTTSAKARKKVELKFRTYEGELRTVEASIGDTLLQVARANDLPSMEGSCGGNLGMSLFYSLQQSTSERLWTSHNAK